jgi:hypothetical protein
VGPGGGAGGVGRGQQRGRYAGVAGEVGLRWFDNL